MGWTAEDEQTHVKERALVQAAKVRTELYVLSKIIKEVKHGEKLSTLTQLADKAWETLDQINFQLSR